MTEQSLSIFFSNTTSNVVEDPYWLNMEMVKDEEVDGMSIGEAATVIDALYDISVCGENPDPYNLNEEQEVDNNPTVADFAQTLRDLKVDLPDVFASLDTCELSGYNIAGEEGAYDADIKVFRSHPGTEIYKLRLSNGTASSPRKITERVTHTLEIEEATSYTVDNPILGRPIIAWVGINGPDLNITGNTIWWVGKASGTIRAEFDTEYDLVHIHVHGEPVNSQIIEGTLPEGYAGEGWYTGDEEASEIVDIQNIQCSVLAFYHYQYEELILNRPEEDLSVSGEEKDAICSALNPDYGYSNTHIGGDDDPPPQSYDTDCFTECEDSCFDAADNCSGEYSDNDCVAEYEACTAACYERCTRWCEQEQEVTKICDCSHNETNWINTYRVVCPSDIRTGGKLPDRDPEVNYIKCNDTDEEVDDPSFYEETCCVPWPFTDRPMPRCQIIYSAYGGSGAISDSLKAQYAARYENVAYIGVGTEDGICGEQSVEQIVTQKNCCLDAPEVFLPLESNITVISDNSSAIIIASGGTSPYTWGVEGDGAFFLDGASQVNKLKTTDSAVTLYTEDCCGTIVITITDVCNESATLYIRAADGGWSTVEYRSWNYFILDPWHEDRSCSYNGEEVTDTPPASAIEDTVNGSDWIRKVIDGQYRITETGDAANKVRAINYDYYCVDSNAERNPDQNVWPSCLGVPLTVSYTDCSVMWDCYYCCKEFDDFIQRSDKYGATVCEKTTYFLGWNILDRRWETWNC